MRAQPTRRLPALAVAVPAVLAALLAVPAAGAPSPALAYAVGTTPLDPAPSLPGVRSGARPGPDVLYADAPRAPQLENRDPRFRVAPVQVSGTEVYQAGEYVYTDYLYDDHGAQTSPLNSTDQSASNDTTVNGLSANALAYQAGNVRYPTDPVYAGNAADLVEFRMVPGEQSTAFRFTLNTLRRADTTMIALALDTDEDPATGSGTLPRDPGYAFPGTDVVLSTWGTGAEVSRLTGGQPQTQQVPVTVDLEADQITVTVPDSVYRPTATVRARLATGLHDPATGGWLFPQPGDPDATTPGADVAPTAALGDVPAIFNLGFRLDEPVQRQNTPPDTDQAVALGRGSDRFSARIDVDALRAGAARSTVPTTGLQIRMYASRLPLGDGQQLEFPQQLGQLQPYALHLPPSGATATAHPLTLSIHSNGQHYWQFDGTGILTGLGDARDSVVLSPLGRGRNGWYIGVSEDDVFEAWADAARHVRLDPDRTAITGYSMGGYATYRLGGLYPDLFGRAFSVVGPPGKLQWIPPMAPTGGIQTLTNLWLENTRNLPYLNYAQTADELVPVTGTVAQNDGDPINGIRGFDQLGYRFRFRLFQGGEHYTLAALGYDFPAAREFLGDAAVDRDPAHVTFAYLPASDDRPLGLVHDHAYWVSDVRLADTSAGLTAKGVLDVRSRAFGTGDPETSAIRTAGVESLPFVETGREWGPLPVTAKENAADVTLTNLAGATLDLPRAQLRADGLVLRVASDTASALRLDGPVPAGLAVTRDGSPVPVTRAAGALTLAVPAGDSVFRLDASRTALSGEVFGSPPAGRLPATGTTASAALAGLVLLLAGAALARSRCTSAARTQ